MSLQMEKTVKGISCNYWKIKDVQIVKPVAKISIVLFASNDQRDDWTNEIYRQNYVYNSGFDSTDLNPADINPTLVAYDKIKNEPQFISVSGCDQITEMKVFGRTAANTESSGATWDLYGKLFLDGSYYTVELYKDESKTQLVASGSTGDPNSFVSLTQTNNSGLTASCNIKYISDNSEWTVVMAKDV